MATKLRIVVIAGVSGALTLLILATLSAYANRAMSEAAPADATSSRLLLAEGSRATSSVFRCSDG